MENDSKRLVIFIFLSGIILFGFNYFYGPKKALKAAPAAQTAQAPAVSGTAAPQTAAGAVPAVEPAAVTAAKTGQSFANVKEQLKSLETDMAVIEFSNISGAMTSYKVKKYSDGKDNEGLVELIPSGSSYSCAILKLPGIPEGAPWKFEGIRKNEGSDSISYSYEIKPGLKVVKEHVFENGTYMSAMNIRFVNSSKSPAAINDAAVQWGPNIHFLPADLEKYKDGMQQFNKIIYPVGTQEKTTKNIMIDFKAKDDKLVTIAEKPSWAAIKDLYFAAAFLFKSTADYKNFYYRQLHGGFTYLAVNLSDLVVDAGSEKAISLDLYAGPQEYKRLKKLGMQGLVDIGWPRFLGIWMFYAMDFFWNLTKNYGWAIIILTLLIRAILWLPSQSSYKQMKETQKKMNIIKPRLETLKKIYKDDAQKLNEETMKLYQEYKINPFGGCLPMLLQLPIFIAFYQMLMNMVELKGAGFIWWMKDLSKPDPIYVLPIFMGISMLIQQKMSQAATPTMDEASATQQKIMLYGMPIFLTYLAFKWPSGLLLYWGMSNVLGILQQFFVNKSK